MAIMDLVRSCRAGVQGDNVDREDEEGCADRSETLGKKIEFRIILSSWADEKVFVRPALTCSACD